MEVRAEENSDRKHVFSAYALQPQNLVPPGIQCVPTLQRTSRYDMLADTFPRLRVKRNQYVN